MYGMKYGFFVDRKTFAKWDSHSSTTQAAQNGGYLGKKVIFQILHGI